MLAKAMGQAGNNAEGALELLSTPGKRVLAAVLGELKLKRSDMVEYLSKNPPTPEAAPAVITTPALPAPAPVASTAPAPTIEVRRALAKEALPAPKTPKAAKVPKAKGAEARLT